MIGNPAPSTALCEATASSARSAARLGVSTAGHRRVVRAFGTPSAARLDGFPRPGWQVSAPGRSEKHPIVTFEPGRDLGARPGAEPARRAHAQAAVFFATTARRGGPARAQQIPTAEGTHAAHASNGKEEEVGEVSVRRQMVSPRPQWPRGPRPLLQWRISGVFGEESIRSVTATPNPHHRFVYHRHLEKPIAEPRYRSRLPLVWGDRCSSCSSVVPHLGSGAQRLDRTAGRVEMLREEQRAVKAGDCIGVLRPIHPAAIRHAAHCTGCSATAGRGIYTTRTCYDIQLGREGLALIWSPLLLCWQSCRADGYR